MWVWKRNLPFKLCTKCYQKSQGSRAHAVIRNDGDDDDDELESDGVAEILDKCFVCEEKPPLKGDVMCRSCKEEHPMCYECGYRKRNLPFKLCTKCYQKSQGSRAHAVIRNDGDDDDNEIDSDGVAEILDELALDQKSGVTPLSNSKVLLPLKSDQNTYKEIAKHIVQGWVRLKDAVRHPPQPLAIFGIQNHEIAKSFRLYGSRIRDRDEGCSNSDLFFHGTKLLCDLVNSQSCCDDADCGICGISLNGFDEKRIGLNIPRYQRFGKGIYLAPNTSKCHDYMQGNSMYGIRAQLLCLVAQGARHELMQDNSKLTGAPEGFDSVYGKNGGSLNYDEIVVYKSNAVWPQYVVVYELNGVDKIAK